MADTSNFRNGFCMIWNDDVWTVIEFMHVKPGKGGAFVRSKLRNIRNGRIVDNTFRAGEKITEARVERRKYQYLYADDLGLHFMNTDTYDQISLPAESIQGREYIKEGGTIDILFHAETEKALTRKYPQALNFVFRRQSPVLRAILRRVRPSRRHWKVALS